MADLKKWFKDFQGKYNYSSQILHAVIGAIIIALIAEGMYMVDLPKSEFKYHLYDLHKSFGMLLLLLLFPRYILRIYNRQKFNIKIFTKYKLLLNKLNYWLSYFLMVTIPLSGWVMSSAGGHKVTFFGLFDFPAIVDKNKEIQHFAREFHEVSAGIMIAFILIHIALVMKNHFIDKNKMLRRMFSK